MANSFYVYKISNKINGKVYIGKTSGIYQNRWKKHVKIAEGKGSYGKVKKYAIHYAIRKHGIENFDFTLLASFETENEAYASEIYHINKYNSIANGYNLVNGGQAQSGSDAFRAIFCQKEIYEIFNFFLAGTKPSKIAKKYKCDKSIIYNILNRQSYCNVEISEEIIAKVALIKKNKIKTRPENLDKKAIATDYNFGMSYRQISKKYNTSTFTVKNIIKTTLGQDIIDTRKMQKISNDFGIKIIKEYLETDLTAVQLAEKYNKNKYCIYDILSGRTFTLNDIQLKAIRLVANSKIGGKGKTKKKKRSR